MQAQKKYALLKIKNVTHEISLGEEYEKNSSNDRLFVSVHERLAELLNDNCERSDLEKAIEKKLKKVTTRLKSH